MADLEIRIEEPIAWLTFNRPSARNALSPELLEMMVEACEDLSGNDDVRVIVVRGQGGIFSAGADLMGFMASMHGEDPTRAADLGRLASEAIMALPQVTVAAIEGHCVGGGLVLAACCDLRWSARDAWFCAPELDLGVPLAWGGMERLVAILGDTLASELVFTCRRLGASDALAHGLISQLLGDDFEAELVAQVGAIAARPLGVLRATKRQLQGIRSGTFDARTDAPALLAALRDPESQRAAQQYFARRAARGRRSPNNANADSDKETSK